MDLRREVRQTIKRGTVVWAEVIDYHLGLATVRLAKGGGILSNLYTVGGVVAVGDKVVIDYSSGVAPIVSPAFITDYEDPDIELAELVPPPDTGIPPPEFPDPPAPDPGPDSNMGIDIGWGATGYHAGGDEIGTAHIGVMEWGFFPHVENEAGYPWSVIWDTNDACLKTGSINRRIETPTTIPQNGTYIIHGSIWWQAYWSQYRMDTPENPSPQDGYYQLAITKNGIIIASVSVRDEEYFTQNRLAQKITTVDDFQAGDLLELWLWQTVLAPGYSNFSYDPVPYYGLYPDWEYNEIRAVLLPGSQGA